MILVLVKLENAGLDWQIRNRENRRSLPGYKTDPVINVRGDAAVQRPLQVHHLMLQQRK